MWKSSSFLLIYSLIVVKTLLFTVILPPWQGPDEPFHFKMGYVLADPLTDLQEVDSDILKSLQQYRFGQYTDYTQEDRKVPRFNTNRLPGYYVILGFLLKFFSGLTLTGKMFLGRFFSATCYLVIVLLIYGISRRVFLRAEGDWFSLAALSFVGFQPQYSFFSVTLNSDNLISFLLTVILFCLVHIASKPREAADTGIKECWLWPVAILAVVAGLLVKRTGLVGLLLFSFSILVVKYRDRGFLFRASALSLALLAVSVFFALFLGSAQENKYLNQFSISFIGVPGDLKVSYQAFDIDSKHELAIILNGKKIASVKRTKNNKWGPSCSFILPDRLVREDMSNVLTFDNVHNPSGMDRWGVRNVEIRGIVEVREPHGNIPRSKMLQGLTPEETRRVAKQCETSFVAKWSARVGKSVRKGLSKLLSAFEVPFHLIVRFILVQFVSFWFSLGWMIYKMSLGWYVLFGLITFLSVAGLIRLVYCRFRNRGFEFMNMRSVSLLILLFALSQFAMVIAYGPSPDSSIDIAMGRCRFMEIGALSILIPLGLWAIPHARRRDMVMKSFVCFMIFLNIVSVIKYIIPIFYL